MSTVLTELSDVPVGPDKHSPRLAAIIKQLPKTTRKRTSNALYSARVYTLAGLCSKKRSDMNRMKAIGRKIIDDLESALATFGLSLGRAVPQEKPQTLGQRLSNPVWLREQLRELLTDCDENIIEDQERAAKMRDDVMRARYEASVDCYRHFRKQLCRILVGKTAMESIADTIRGHGDAA